MDLPPSFDFKYYGKAGQKTSRLQSEAEAATNPAGTRSADFKYYGKAGQKTSGRQSEVVAGASPAGMTFFRERMLKKGTLMTMPDIRDEMPRRSFLPRAVLAKLPFSSSKLAELKHTFRAADNSSKETMIVSALAECERPPSPGETKRCVGSIEDMVDFSTSVLGPNVVARSTDNTVGSLNKILVGQVLGMNAGMETETVSYHQTIYLYLLYYCRSVPRVRVYEVEILNGTSSKPVMNHGVTICHMDTTSWSPTHAAFLSLGHGKIEVCHWMVQHDLIWARSERVCFIPIQ